MNRQRVTMSPRRPTGRSLSRWSRFRPQLHVLEDQVGSLEEGKLADFVVVDRDILTCPVDDLKATRVERTYWNGKMVFERK